MDREKLMQEVVVEHLRRKFLREYREVKINKDGSPDSILANHGLTRAVVEVETEKGITAERAEKWEERAQSGVTLIMAVSEHARSKTLALLWKEGIADKVAAGSYEIQIHI